MDRITLASQFIKLSKVEIVTCSNLVHGSKIETHNLRDEFFRQFQAACILLLVKIVHDDQIPNIDRTFGRSDNIRQIC